MVTREPRNGGTPCAEGFTHQAVHRTWAEMKSFYSWLSHGRQSWDLPCHERLHIESTVVLAVQTILVSMILLEVVGLTAADSAAVFVFLPIGS